MKKELIFLFLILLCSSLILASTHSASEIKIDVDGSVYSLQEIVDGGYFGLGYENPVSPIGQYEVAGDICVFTVNLGITNLLDVLKSGETASLGGMDYSGCSSFTRHIATEIVFDDGPNTDAGDTLQDAIANNAICVPKTCEDLGYTCGSGYDDGCGGKTGSCGSCTYTCDAVIV